MTKASNLPLIRYLLGPLMLFMILLSLWEQRLFFAILGIWSLYLMCYPLYRGHSIREPLLVLIAVVLTVPYILLVVHIYVPLYLVFLMRIAELWSIYAVGLFTFHHLVSYWGMRLDRVSITILCTTSTISMGMMFVLGQYLNNILFGFLFIETNQILMEDLALTFIGALTMSAFLYIYLHWKGIYIIESLEKDSPPEVTE